VDDATRNEASCVYDGDRQRLHPCQKKTKLKQRFFNYSKMFDFFNTRALILSFFHYLSFVQTVCNLRESRNRFTEEAIAWFLELSRGFSINIDGLSPTPKKRS